MLFKWLSQNKHKSYYSDQSQQEQTARWANQNSWQLPATCSKRGKNRAYEVRLVLVLVLLLIGWKTGVSRIFKPNTKHIAIAKHALILTQWLWHRRRASAELVLLDWCRSLGKEKNSYLVHNYFQTYRLGSGSTVKISPHEQIACSPLMDGFFSLIFFLCKMREKPLSLCPDSKTKKLNKN